MAISPGQLVKILEQRRRKILVYARLEWPKKAGLAALDFVDGNFQAQGFRDNTLIPWKGTKSGKKVKFGTKSNILQGSPIPKMRYNTRMRVGDGESTLFNNTKYAAVHNEGYNSMQQVRAHNRRKKLKGFVEGPDGSSYPYGSRQSLKTRKNQKAKPVTMVEKVRAFTRHMRIQRRQFMPTTQRPSRWLNNQVREMTTKDIQRIMRY